MLRAKSKKVRKINTNKWLLAACTLWLVALQAVAKGYAFTMVIILHAESANSIKKPIIFSNTVELK